MSKDIVCKMKLIKNHPKTSTSGLQSYFLLVNAAATMGIDFHYLLMSISAYATQNYFMYSTVNKFIQAGKFYDLAKVLHKDKQNLPLLILYERLEKKVAFLQIIMTIKEEFFNVNKDFPDNHQLWNHTCKSKNFMSNQALALKRNDELVAKAALYVAKKQKSADEVTAIFEAIQTNQRIKKQASREIPNSVKGEKVEKGRKYIKQLSIQIQVNLQENILIRPYEKRSKAWL